MKEDDSAIEMFVGGLVLDPNTQAPVVVLKDETGAVHLPIWIGVTEATSIASAIKELEMARPLTHDLMIDIISQAGLRVVRVVITELKDSTYFAELILALGDRAVIFDSRPSDAIAIALRASAPIFVAESVLRQAQITFDQQTSGKSQSGADSEQDGVNSNEADSGQDKSGNVEGSANTGEETIEGNLDPSPDFKAIDKEKWREILADLDPEDFKYKT